MASSIDRALRRSKRKLDRIPKQFRPVIVGTQNQNADELMAAQRARVPRRRGTLYASIRKEQAPERLGVLVRAGGPSTMVRVRKGLKAGDTVAFSGRASTTAAGGDQYDYALGIEFGTEKMSARPFFYGPGRLLKRRFKSRVTRNLKKETRQVAK